VFDVTNSPLVGDEKTTLETLARRFVDERGGWTWELSRVTVRSQGAIPDPTPHEPDALEFKSLGFSREAGNVTRVAAPGALADLDVSADLPSKLVLGKSFSLAVSVAAVPSTL